MGGTVQTPSVKAPPPEGAEQLLQKCHHLLSELEELQAFITERKKEHAVDIRQFQNSVRSELKSLEKVWQSSSSFYL